MPRGDSQASGPPAWRAPGRIGWLPALVVLGVAAALSYSHLTGPVRYGGPDSLFYQAQTLEVRGQAEATARRHVFDGPLGRLGRAQERSPHIVAELEDPGWIRYSARFYRRRWFVPAMAAALNPLFGARSLQIVSQLGFLLIVVLLYALLRFRFRAWTSAAAAIGIALLPPLRWYSADPLTDSWGLALLVLALIAGVLMLTRGERWLAAWAAALALLSITREDYVVAVVAACGLALAWRTGRTLWLGVTALVSTLPASLLLGASARDTLAYTENGFRPPRDASWGFVLSHYPTALRDTIRGDVLMPHEMGWSAGHAAAWYAACAVALGALVLLFVERRGADPFFGLLRASLVGALVYIAVSVNFTAFRLELAFLPALAVGLAMLLDRIRTPLEARLGRTYGRPPPPRPADA